MTTEAAALELPDHPKSYWLDSTERTAYPRLTETVEADVAVVGAGIAGISTATFLAEDGHDVALLDASRVAEQTTGHTSAKLTVAHGLRYDYLRKTFGEERARLYADANRTALEEVARRCGDADQDCDFHRSPAYTYVPTQQKRRKIEKEVDAARRLGLDASFVEDVPAPVDAAAAIRYENQARFHPRKYLLSLLDSFEQHGGEVYEDTRVTDLETGSPHTVAAGEGRVRADDVVVATHYPFYRPLLYAMRTMPGQAHIIVTEVEGEPPEGLYYSAGSQAHSFRPIDADDRSLLLVEGHKHPTGLGGDTLALTRKVESYAASTFPVRSIPYRWSAQDYKTMDRVPYIGPISPLSDGVYVATGFNAWGMTHGTVAGLLLSDLVAGRDNPWERLYTPNRIPPMRSLKRLPKAGGNMMNQFLTGKRGVPDADGGPDLGPGEGAVVKKDGRTVGLYRSRDGELRAVSGTCSYDGCTLVRNEAEETWDCPCDGSRFTNDGRVFDGPAQEDLDPVIIR